MGRAIAYFTKWGYVVSIPLNDCQDYDLVVEIGGSLKKIQVKTTRHRSVNKSMEYKVSLSSSGGTNGSVYHSVKDGSSDLVFVALENGIDYLIPNVDLPKRYLTLNEKMSKYIV